MSAAVVNPTLTAFLPHHTSQSRCTSGDDAFATQIPSTNRSLRFTGVGRLCGNKHQVHQDCVLVCYRKRVMPLTAKCLQRNVFNLSSPTLHVREIPFLVSHATFLPFPYTYPGSIVRVHVRHRARTSRSTRTPSTGVAWTRTSFCVFYPSNFVPVNLTFPKQITWGMLKKKKKKKKKGRDATCGVWTTSSACQLRACGQIQ